VGAELPKNNHCENCGTDFYGFTVPFAVSTTLLTVLAPLLITVSG
jgi:hypothetical protein